MGRVKGRCGGLRFYAAGLTCSGELYVFNGAHDPGSVKLDGAAARVLHLRP